jgi:hypothetical protein
MYDGARHASAPSTGQGGGGSWDTPPKAVDKAASTPQGCSLIPWEGNSCESQAIGGVTQKVTDLGGGLGNTITHPGRTWADTGGGIVNTVGDAVSPYGGAIVVIGSAALCVAAILGGPELCLPLVGVLAYTAGNTGNNMIVHGDLSVTDGWRWQDALVTAAATTVFPFVAPEIPGAVATSGTALGVGFLLGAGSDIASQEFQNPGGPVDWNHAGCQGVAGLYGAAALVGNGWGGLFKGLGYAAVTTAAGNTLCSGQ